MGAVDAATHVVSAQAARVASTAELLGHADACKRRGEKARSRGDEVGVGGDR